MNEQGTVQKVLEAMAKDALPDPPETQPLIQTPEMMEQLKNIRELRFTQATQRRLTWQEQAFRRMNLCPDEQFTGQGLCIQDLETKVPFNGLRFNSRWDLVLKDNTVVKPLGEVDEHLLQQFKSRYNQPIITGQAFEDLSRNRTAVARGGLNFLEKDLEELNLQLSIATRWLAFCTMSTESPEYQMAMKEGFGILYLKQRTLDEQARYTKAIQEQTDKLVSARERIEYMFELEIKVDGMIAELDLKRTPFW